MLHSSVDNNCLRSCVKQVKTCTIHCQNNCYNCSNTACSAQKKNYTAYVREQQLIGGEITRSLGAYKDVLRCTKISCDCRDDYKLCEESCHGEIYKHLTVPTICSHNT